LNLRKLIFHGYSLDLDCTKLELGSGDLDSDDEGLRNFDSGIMEAMSGSLALISPDLVVVIVSTIT
jgi:hypothetical protein